MNKQKIPRLRNPFLLRFPKTLSLSTDNIIPPQNLTFHSNLGLQTRVVIPLSLPSECLCFYHISFACYISLTHFILSFYYHLVKTKITDWIVTRLPRNLQRQEIGLFTKAFRPVVKPNHLSIQLIRWVVSKGVKQPDMNITDHPPPPLSGVTHEQSYNFDPLYGLMADFGDRAV